MDERPCRKAERYDVNGLYFAVDLSSGKAKWGGRSIKKRAD
jgi:hypothetical protein